jgi:hypothetical protein
MALISVQWIRFAKQLFKDAVGLVAVDYIERMMLR